MKSKLDQRKLFASMMDPITRHCQANPGTLQAMVNWMRKNCDKDINYEVIRRAITGKQRAEPQYGRARLIQLAFDAVTKNGKVK